MILKRDKNNWKNHTFSTGSSTGSDYKAFEKDSKNDLENMAKENGLCLHSFNKNHYCFSAVLSDGNNYVYVSQSDVRFFDIDKILIRTMEHDHDWHGGRNQYCKWSEIGREAKRIIATMA